MFLFSPFPLQGINEGWQPYSDNRAAERFQNNLICTFEGRQGWERWTPVTVTSWSQTQTQMRLLGPPASIALRHHRCQQPAACCRGQRARSGVRCLLVGPTLVRLWDYRLWGCVSVYRHGSCFKVVHVYKGLWFWCSLVSLYFLNISALICFLYFNFPLQTFTSLSYVF